VERCGHCEQVTWHAAPHCPHCGAEDWLTPDPTFELVCGERRWLAIGTLGWATVPCLVRAMDDRQASDVMLLENLQRVDLNPIEEAQAYATRIARFTLTVGELAQTVSKSAEYVRERLALLQLAPPIQQLIATGQLPLAHAQLLVDLDPDRQRIALRAFNAIPAMSLVAFTDVVRRLAGEQEKELAQPLFELTFITTLQAEAKYFVPWGKHAQVDIVQAPGITWPELVVAKSDLPGDVLNRFMHDLQSCGLVEGAAAVGKVYAELVRGRKVMRAATPLARTRTR
jgi:ParB/RepB/Spo0J family partition protein